MVDPVSELARRGRELPPRIASAWSTNFSSPSTSHRSPRWTLRGSPKSSAGWPRSTTAAFDRSLPKTCSRRPDAWPDDSGAIPPRSRTRTAARGELHQSRAQRIRNSICGSARTGRGPSRIPPAQRSDVVQGHPRHAGEGVSLHARLPSGRRADPGHRGLAASQAAELLGIPHRMKDVATVGGRHRRRTIVAFANGPPRPQGTA